MIAGIYQNYILKNPKYIIVFLLICLVSFGYHSKNFRLDASSDTLLLEDDPDLKYLREITNTYGSKDFLVLTYTPKEEITSKKVVNNLLSLKYKIQSLDWVHNVITILDIPLFSSTDQPISEKLKKFKTLKDENINIKAGFEEILSSPVFRNFVISEDGKTTGIIINLKSNPNIKELKFKNNAEIERYKDSLKEKNHENILEIRKVINLFEKDAQIFLGGIPMIADDMISFIKNDIIYFGVGVFLFIIATLWYVFRSWIWIVIPISSCFFSVFIMVGLLGLIGWKVTVISSNFIALMLILTMAMNIHLSTRLLQLKKNNPSINKFDLIKSSTSKMVWPIVYTVLTTICAFLSLIFSGIKPIIDFGWMMTLGLLISFSVTFLLLPTLINFFPLTKIDIKEEKSHITNYLSNISITNKNLVIIFSSLLLFISIFGISKLEVENSFINYFKKSTEIYKGMKLIDEKLGGTTPLEIILNFPQNKIEKVEDDEFEDWDNEDDGGNEKYFRLNKNLYQQGEIIYITGTQLFNNLNNNLSINFQVNKNGSNLISKEVTFNIESNRWEGEFRAPSKGEYDFQIFLSSSSEPIQKGKFEVVESQIELSNVFLRL